MSKSCMLSIENSIIESFNLPQNTRGHNLFILRDDLIHPIISGNKWRKLRYVIEEAKRLGVHGIVTYGGAFSNHLVATATVCKLHHIPCILKVRGNELNANSNAYLRHCAAEGAMLEFMDRVSYSREKLIDSVISIEGNAWLSVPEGGASILGLKGCLEIITPAMEFDVIALAQGTTTTSLGVLLSTTANTTVWTFPVLKGFDASMEMGQLADKFEVFSAWEKAKQRLVCFEKYHFSGYGKQRELVNQQIQALNIQGAFALDPVYTAKAFIGMISELQKIDEPKRVLFIHTGGVLGL